jgi:hypothetical protein
MNAETILTVGYVLWTFVTVAIYVAYRVDAGAQREAWKRVEEERRKLHDDWQALR